MANLLIQEGVSTTDIDTGNYLDEAWISDAISVYDIIEELATKSSYQWGIDVDGVLYFYDEPDTFVDCDEEIVDAGSFTDFWEFSVGNKLDGYANKLFVNGGKDVVYENQILVNSENYTESAIMQQATAGSGVFGEISQDSSIKDASYAAAQAGTNTTDIIITSHGIQYRDMIWNKTRNAYRQVSVVVSANEVTVPAITGQTTGDIIVIYYQANDFMRNKFRTCSKIPQEISFKTKTLTFNPGERLHVELEDFNIYDSYYLIEEITITDSYQRLDVLQCEIKATLRTETDFTTKPNKNFSDYFINF